ncbi:MAG: metallophosphoesterase [Pseudomonadota bacterium]|nr:metallophosphoesterase [Pseudomonadota bacterium]
MSQVRRALAYARGISRALRRGDTFPAAGRVPARDAPGGTTRALQRHGLAELDHIEISEHVVRIPGLLRPIEILHLTDVHLRGRDAWVDRLASLVSEQRPDLIALTGDIVTRGWQPDAVDHFLGALPDAPLGKWAVMGNWEYWGGAPRDVWEPVLTRHGITLLHERVVPLDGLDLVGTDDLLAGNPDLDSVLASVRRDHPALVLTHSPALFPLLAGHPLRAPTGLVLAGHTHGGQVRIPVLGPFFLPRGSGAYPWGWYELDGVHLFVSRGLGWSVAPVRWRCPPEIARIRMVPG